MKQATLSQTDFPFTWLYEQFHAPSDTGHASCYLCGASCQEQHALDKAVADTFNSHYLARCPSSSYLCAACAWYLDNSGVHPDFRKMSLVVQRTSWRNWQRETMKADITRWLTHGLDTESYLVVSLTKKKHILLQAPLNAASSRTLSLQVEEQRAYLDREMWNVMDTAFTALLRLGHNKSEILSGNLYAHTLRKHGQIARAMQVSRQLAPYRHSPELELLSYVTLVEESKTTESETPDNAGRDDEQSGAGDGRHPPVRALAQSGMESNRQRVQEQVPHGDMDAVREHGVGSGADVQYAPEVSQHTLW